MAFATAFSLIFFIEFIFTCATLGCLTSLHKFRYNERTSVKDLIAMPSAAAFDLFAYWQAWRTAIDE